MNTSKENVLVVGANGTTGKLLINYLNKSQYFNPVAMVRKKEQLAQFKNQGIDTVLGDLEEDLVHVTNGIDKVIFAAGSGGNTSAEKTTLVDQEGAKRVIDAAKTADIKKFVMLSAINADQPESGGDLSHYLEAKKIADEHLKNSGIPYTIVRPGMLTNDKGTGKIKADYKVERGKITRDDVAYTLVHVLNDGIANNSVFEMIAGNERIEDATKRF